MRRGEVYWFRFRTPDKRRPVLVLTRSGLLPSIGTATVAHITSTAREVASQVSLGPEHGMPKPCAVNLLNVSTLKKAELGPYLTTLDGEVMNRVDEALQFALGIGETGNAASLQ